MKTKTKTPKIESTRASNAFKLHFQTLYSSPYRRSIPAILILLLLGQLAGLICAGFWLSFEINDYWYYQPYNQPGRGISESLYRFLAVLKWVLIPFLGLLLSLTDTWCRWRRTLGPKRALASAIAGFLGWAIYLSLGFLNGGANISFAVFASPGVIGCGVYAMLAGFAIRRGRREEKKVDVGEEFGMESVEGEQSSVRRSRGEVVAEPAQPRSWRSASFPTPSEQLPAYSAECSHDAEEVEPHTGWRRGVIEFERRARSFEMPKETVDRGEELSFADSSIRAGSSQLPTYRSSVSASLNSEDLRSFEERGEQSIR